MKLFQGQETFRILVIAAMMASVTSAAGELAQRLAPSFDPTLLVLLSFLVVLEGIATDRLARRLPEAAARQRFHFAEWAVILVLLRLALSLSQGFGAFALAAALWLERPQSLVDTGLVLAAILLFAVWLLGTQMAHALEALDPEADEPPPKDSAAYYSWLTRPRGAQQGEGWESLVRLFLTGGVLLILCSGLARLDITAALSLRHPAIAGIVANALLYFVLGFTLLGQGHYSLLRTRWERQRVTVAQPLAKRWAILALTFAVGLALAALLLPVRPSLSLFGAAFDFLLQVLYVVTALLFGILGILGYLLSLLARLLGMSMRPQGGSMPIFPTPVPKLEPAVRAVPWWEAFQGLILWVIILAVLTYALIRFVRERRGLWQSLIPREGPLAWIVGLLGALWRWLAKAGLQVGERFRTLVARRPVASGLSAGRRRLAWLRPRTAQEQVRLLYLLALQQTARLGWMRRPVDTPYEYAQRLEHPLPEAQEDLRALTQAFVEARYSLRDFAVAEVGPLRTAYRRLRQLCRQIAARRLQVGEGKLQGSGQPTENGEGSRQ